MSKTLHFSIQGEFIMNLAREKAYVNNDIPSALKVLDTLTSADQDPDTILLTKIKILDGSIDIEGTYPDEPITTTEGKHPNKLLPHLTKMHERLTELEDEHERQLDIFNTIMDTVPESYLKEINEKFGETIFPLEANDIINKVLNYHDSEYGWLAPDGTWYPVDYADHENWARKYLIENGFTEQDFIKFDIHSSADYLVYHKHFCLVHSPSMAEPVLDYKGLLTKAQKEFLYDYFNNLKLYDKANDLYKDDNNE